MGIMRNRRGFTLIEVMVVAGIIAILAGILVPMIFNQVDESKKSKAQAEIKSLQTAISKFKMDNSAWPNRVDGSDPTTNTVQVLFTPGNAIVSAADWPLTDLTVSKKAIDYLGPVQDRNYPAAKWKGPYMSSIDADPWGNTYLVSAKNFESKTGLPVWILSAGPDGIIQTPIDSAFCYDGYSIDPATGLVAAGDDICLRFM